MDNFKWLILILLLTLTACHETPESRGSSEYYQKAYDLIGKNLVQSEELAQESVTLATQEGVEGQRGRSLYLLAYIQERQDDYYHSLLNYHEAYKSLYLSGNLKQASDALTNIGLIFFKKYSYDKARYFYKESLYLKEQQTDTLGLAETYRHLAQTFRFLEEYDSAILYNSKALPLLRHLGKTQSEAMVLLELGLSRLEQDDFKQAEENFQSVLNLPNLEDKLTGRAFNNLGLMNLEQQQWKEAKKYLEKASIIPDGDWSKLVLKNNLGKIHRQYGNYDSAQHYFKAVLRGSDNGSFNLKNQEYFRAQDNLISIYTELGQKDSIIHYYREKDVLMTALYENQKVNQQIYDQFILLKAYLAIREKEHQEQIQEEKQVKRYMAGASGLLVILMAGGIGYYMSQYKNSENYFERSKEGIIEDLKRF